MWTFPEENQKTFQTTNFYGQNHQRFSLENIPLLTFQAYGHNHKHEAHNRIYNQ